ncbi:MAG: formimidoylglutamase [Phycisphaerales bacterium]|nr:formimidoylglutamase [Phycisphaerales bacterium]
MIPHCVPASYPSMPESRLASQFRRDDPAGCAIAILGMPDDLGVRLNNGRPGAKEGPAAFRAALARYGVAVPPEFDLPRVFDAGDVQPPECEAGNEAGALEEMHRRVSDAAETLAKRGMTVVGIGGGHDLTYALVRGVARAQPNKGKSMLGLYYDAHLDVRESIGSGMPFRWLLEEKIVAGLRIVGFSPEVNSREHTQWFLKNRGTLGERTPPRIGGLPDDPNSRGFVSVDLDAIDMSSAPGVSAPNPAGLAARDVAEDLKQIGFAMDLACLDFMELCPAHDEDGRTARLAAHLFVSYLHGIGSRNPIPLV